MTTTIRQILKEAPVTVHEDDDLALALQVMVWGDLRHLPVMRGDALVGLLSERDVLRRYAQVGRRAGAREKAGAAMSRPPVALSPDDDVGAAIALVTERGIGCVPVVEAERLVGIVTRRDLLSQKIEHDEEPGVESASPAWSHLLVDDVMSRDPLTASPDDALPVLVDRLGRHGVRHLPVVDAERRVIGMLSDRDVRTAIGNPLRALDRRDARVRIESTRASHVMSRAPLTLPAGTRLLRAAALFADHKIGALPIVDESGHLVGVVSYTDVLRAVVGPKPNVS
jgi:acetoin utilization protein AcuB